VSRSLRQRKHDVPVSAWQQEEHAAAAILQLFFTTHLMMPTLHMRYTKNSTTKKTKQISTEELRHCYEEPMAMESRLTDVDEDQNHEQPG
jgi:flagellar biosynthesis protein FliP